MGQWRDVSNSGGKREVYRNGERAHAMETWTGTAHGTAGHISMQLIRCPANCTRRMPSGHACEEKRKTRAQCTYDATH
jgi:hypothetical protein